MLLKNPKYYLSLILILLCGVMKLSAHQNFDFTRSEGKTVVISTNSRTVNPHSFIHFESVKPFSSGTEATIFLETNCIEEDECISFKKHTVKIGNALSFFFASPFRFSSESELKISTKEPIHFPSGKRYLSLKVFRI